MLVRFIIQVLPETLYSDSMLFSYNRIIIALAEGFGVSITENIEGTPKSFLPGY